MCFAGDTFCATEIVPQKQHSFIWGNRVLMKNPQSKINRNFLLYRESFDFRSQLNSILSWKWTELRWGKM